ncbi:hypothetical protein DASC09_040730 [Saccharomycopsis crataegensis]|uniref:TLC domain-containing protein n=1 Tax=Saccharomycopsis crataegensis TaxID=43959 RepID=A0AAV5QRI5_9ASCO|nr:hypothetical protein DASC09_040730 [Saccharomycopsis crataegensis]
MILMYHDPLADYKLPLISDILPLFINTSPESPAPPAWAVHLHEVVYCLMLCHLIYSITGNFLQRKFGTAVSHKKSRKDPAVSRGVVPISRLQISNVKIQAVSVIMCTILIVIALPLYYDPLLNQVISPNRHNRYPTDGSDTNVDGNKYTPFSGFACALSLGYHMYLMICIHCQLSFLHSFFFVYQLAYVAGHVALMNPFGHQYLWRILFMDFTSVFLHIRWFALIFPDALPRAMRVINDGFVVVTLVCCKLMGHLWLVINVIQDMSDLHLYQWPPILLSISMTVCAFLDLYWLGILVRVMSFEYCPIMCSFFSDEKTSADANCITINVVDTSITTATNPSRISPCTTQYFSNLQPDSVFSSSLYADDNPSDAESYNGSISDGQ